MGLQVRPWFVVFHRFPEPKATYMIPGRDGSHWTASTLAEFMTGPIETHFRSNSDSLFKFKYCSQESRRGLFASWDGIKPLVPAVKKMIAEIIEAFIFICEDLSERFIFASLLQAFFSIDSPFNPKKLEAKITHTQKPVKTDELFRSVSGQETD